MTRVAAAVALTALTALLLTSCASSADRTATTTTTAALSAPAAPFDPVAPVAPTDWAGPTGEALAAAGAVVSALASDLDEERILASCPFDGVFDGFNVAGFAEPEGSLLCLDGDANTEVLIEGSLVVGATVPEEFEVLLGEDYEVSDAVAFGAGEFQTACAGDEVCVARWRAEDFEVIVIDFVVDDPDEAPELLPTVIAAVVEGTAGFDLADVGV